MCSNAESSCETRDSGVVAATIEKKKIACVYMGAISYYDSSERCGPCRSCFGLFFFFLNFIQIQTAFLLITRQPISTKLYKSALVEVKIKGNVPFKGEVISKMLRGP